MTLDFRRILAAMVAIATLFISTEICAVPRVLFTIDVESTYSERGAFALPQQVDAVCEGGSSCGLIEVAGMLKERGLAGTFFLNVYEYPKWGKATMRGIAANLVSAGQDVALHTHPGTAYDPLRTEMYQYSLDEQTTIIREGMQLLREWTGRPVVAHRAGNYSADERTLEALGRNGLYIDSSLFWGHPHCRLTKLGLPRNLPVSIGKLVEIPVTIYQREERPSFLANSFSPISSIRKIDVNWFMDKNEARMAIDAVVDADLPFLVVFLHSFSFLTGKGQDGFPIADRKAHEIFREILEYVNKKNLPVVTIRELADSKTMASVSKHRDVIPRVTAGVGIHRYFWHRLRRTERVTELLFVTGFILLTCSGVLVAARHRKRVGNVHRPLGPSENRQGGS